MSVARSQPLPPKPPDGGDGGDHRGLVAGESRLTPLRELQLVEAHRKGDAGATAELLEGYQRRVYAVCYRMVRHVEEARDLAQDAMVKMLEGLGTYDGRCQLSTWVIRVTMNTCLSHLRKRKLRNHKSLDQSTEGRGERGRSRPSSVQPVAKGELPAGVGVERGELRETLLRALDSLEPDMRAVIVLRDMQDLDYAQVGEVIGAPVGTVKSRLFRARSALREAVERELGRGATGLD